MADIAPPRVTTDAPGLCLGLCLVALSLTVVLLLAPLAVVFAEALRDGVSAAFASLGERDARAAIRLTLSVAVIAVPLIAIAGFAAAGAIAKFDFRGMAMLISLIDLPFSVSPVVVGLALVLLYGTHGLLGGWLTDSGLKIVFALPNIVLATLFITFPFVARELFPVMTEQGRAEEEAALTPGASGRHMIRTVTLPNVRWSLLYGVLLCNTRAMGDYEPLGALYTQVRLELRAGLREIHDATGLTTVFVTHDQEEALTLADRVAIMSMGRIEQVGTLVEIRRSPAPGFVQGFLRHSPVGIASWTGPALRAVNATDKKC